MLGGGAGGRSVTREVVGLIAASPIGWRLGGSVGLFAICRFLYSLRVVGGVPAPEGGRGLLGGGGGGRTATWEDGALRPPFCTYPSRNG